MHPQLTNAIARSHVEDLRLEAAADRMAACMRGIRMEKARSWLTSLTPARFHRAEQPCVEC